MLEVTRSLESLKQESLIIDAPVSATGLPNKKETLQDAVMRLGNLSELDYELIRKSEATELEIRTEALDRAVKGARPESIDDSKGGREVKFDDCDMSTHDVIGSEALTEALAHITRHMYINIHDAVISTLWAAHTHIYSKFNHTPRLIISAPEPECGKTVLLFHMIGNFSNKPLATDNLSPAVYFRLAEKHEPTFLIDEGDVFINQDSDLIAGFNNGFEPHGGVFRCVGDDHDVRKFPTFAPLALAGIQLENKLPSATRSRAFIIQLERVSDEISEEDSWDKDIHRNGLLNTRKKIARWTRDHSVEISLCKPDLPKCLKNRSKDKWSPLFSIAQLAGGEWPIRVLNAYNNSVKAHEPTKSEQFLMDVQSVMPKTGSIHTHTLIEKLCKIEDSRYKEYNFKAFESEKKKIQSIQVSNLLKKYKIKPKNITVLGNQKKGYDRESLTRIFKRYISKHQHGFNESSTACLESGNLPVQPSDLNNHKGFGGILPVLDEIDKTDKNTLKGERGKGSDGWTGKITGSEEVGGKGSNYKESF